MTIDVGIKDNQTGKTVRITEQTTLATSNYDFSNPVPVTLDAANAPKKVVSPVQNRVFIITEIILYANRAVGANDATITLYESDSPAADQVGTDVVLFSQELLKQSSLTLTGLNWKVSPGKFINATTDDNTVFLNLGGYYAPF